MNRKGIGRKENIRKKHGKKIREERIVYDLSFQCLKDPFGNPMKKSGLKANALTFNR